MAVLLFPAALLGRACDRGEAGSRRRARARRAARERARDGRAALAALPPRRRRRGRLGRLLPGLPRALLTPLDGIAQPPREREAQLAPALLHEPQAEEVEVPHELVVVVEPARLAR